MKTLKSKILVIPILLMMLVALIAIFQQGNAVYAEETAQTAESSQSKIIAGEKSSGNNLELSGDDVVYRGGEITYTARYFTPMAFITFSSDSPDVVLQQASNVGNCFYQQIFIKENALLYSTFKLIAKDEITSETVTKTITVMPLYAMDIDKIALTANGAPLNQQSPLARPGDNIKVSIQSFVVDNTIYGLADDVTFTDFALVLDSTANNFADVDDYNLSIKIKNVLNTANPIVTFTVVIIQPGAPDQYRNLVKEISLKIYIPVTTFDVLGESGSVGRGEYLNYSVQYNSNNVASVKGFDKMLYDQNNNPLYSSEFFVVDMGKGENLNTNFGIDVSKLATFGSGIKLVLKCKDDPKLTKTIQLDVEALEAGYTLKYSKDYQGNVNPNNGIQLLDYYNKTQLRPGYNADILFEGSTTKAIYTADGLRGYGINVNFDNNISSYLRVSRAGTMNIVNDAPAITNGNRTAYDYTIDISDGSRSYNRMAKTVEVYKPLNNSSYASFYLKNGSATVNNNGSALEPSYDLIFETQGNNFSAQAMDLTYTTNDSNVKITKDYANKKLYFQATSLDKVGDRITITVKNNVTYNNNQLDETWEHSITVKRGFIASTSQLNNVRNDFNSSYKLTDDFKMLYWTPMPEFKGTFDGNGKTLTLIIFKNEGNAGFIETNYGTVKNLTIKGLLVTSSNGASWRNVGMFAADNYGTIDNCKTLRMYNDNSIVTYYPDTKAYGGQYFDMVVEEDLARVGGIVGNNHSSATISNCYNNSHIFSRGDMGGIAGTSLGNIYNSHNNGKLSYRLWTNNRAIGGIVGYQSGGKIDYCNNYAYIYYENIWSDSRYVQPRIGRIAGHRLGIIDNYNSAGTVYIGTLHTETWKGGFLNLTTYKHNQALYAGNRAFGAED